MQENKRMSDKEAWIAMFRRIPASLHDMLALKLQAGELVLQKIVKLDPEFLVVRGRLAGTQDTGRIVMIPWEKIIYLTVQRELKDTEVEAMFGQALETFAAAPVPTAAAPEPAPAEKPTPAAEPAAPPKKPSTTSKSVLVAKLRERLRDK
jgi:hypothetical protein